MKSKLRKGVPILQKNQLNVIELFAGVGGFRLGLEQANKDLFKTVWANQWEPSRKEQHAFNCYNARFQEGIASNEDITKVTNETFIDLKPDLLVGGFPCQDYSVARSLSGEAGLQGKKGVLFWEIARILDQTQPKYVLLENVDRLLKSPSKQRGRDFAVMLATFRDLNYSVEWRVVNAADYGFAQRRRRVFIFAYKNDIAFDDSQRKHSQQDLIYKEGYFAKTFPVKEEPYKERVSSTRLPEDVVDISDLFSYNFQTSGIMQDGEVTTIHTQPIEMKPVTLGEILQDEETVPEEFYLSETQAEKFAYLRGPKKIERTSADGHSYTFSEGGMSPTDELNKPGRTMLTSEGTTNRSTHVVEVNGRKRFLTPLECERLNGFEDHWTEGMPNRMRYFCMGNALVVGLIKKMGERIEEIEKTNAKKEVQLNLSI
ncbi:DNA (cytosine-5-)-methyltransferase [Chryseomicrobium aureum]|uniref:DNA (cytosine-5-)-methyltransferase n=1 Tax=Chryseomicrobium aureum TaxID=1441723 RepID=UPI00370DA67E